MCPNTAQSRLGSVPFFIQEVTFQGLELYILYFRGFNMETEHGQVRIVAGMPMYNEEETIGTVVTMALRHVDEVICIDDGSSDSSARIGEACGANVIRHRGKQG